LQQYRKRKVVAVKKPTDSLDYLVASDNLQIEESGSDLIAFNPQTQTFHLLNETAHEIIKLCDGSRTVREIAIQVSRKFECNDIPAVEADVKQTIDIFRTTGLVSVLLHASAPEITLSSAVEDSPLFALSLSGSSMFPILLPTDKVLVKRCALDELHPGDVTVWSNSGKFVAHRVISVSSAETPSFIVTKGDFCTEPDPPVEAERVVGKVIAVLRANILHWMRELDTGQKAFFTGQAPAQNLDELDSRRPSFVRMQVLDLREISVESIRSIECVEQISLVLLSPQNAHVWPEVNAKDVKSVVTVPETYKVYTGQPELLPEMIEFLPSPLSLVVCGQVFLTAFQPGQIKAAFKHLVLKGQAYVSSQAAKKELEAVTTVVTGSVCIAPQEHIRWMGASILGPEYAAVNQEKTLIAIGDLTPSPRLESVPAGATQFNSIELPAKEHAATQ
jgi:signal peptidase I